MNAIQEKLFLELRQTKMELEQSLMSRQNRDWLTNLLESELRDVNAAICKFEQGQYGKCERTGEWLPENLLQIIPTVKSVNDSEIVNRYYKKKISTLDW